MGNVETYASNPAALNAIKNPTEQNINEMVRESLNEARKMTDYILRQCREKTTPPAQQKEKE